MFVLSITILHPIQYGSRLRFMVAWTTPTHLNAFGEVVLFPLSHVLNRLELLLSPPCEQCFPSWRHSTVVT